MIRVRPAAERGHFDHGWLDTWHTFSFADYHDPEHVRFRALRVINEDRVAPGRGFGAHGHRDMEILTWVLDGALRHEDSLGSGSVIVPGRIQRMTAGTGVLHSEMNDSPDAPVHLLQIWILPERAGLAPGYEERDFADTELRDRLRVVADPDGADGAVRVHQDVRLAVGRLGAGTTVTHALAPGRHAWVQVARGAVDVNGTPLRAGDGAAITDETALRLHAREASEVLLFDLA